MNTLKSVLSRLDKKKLELSSVSEAESMYDKLSTEVTGLASDSYPVYADNTVFAQLVDAYYEITEQILDTLSQYDFDKTYEDAKQLASSAMGIEAYALLERGIKDAEESMKYVNMPWEEAYEKLKSISFTNL